jgi:hypothetical protein
VPDPADPFSDEERHRQRAEKARGPQTAFSPWLRDGLNIPPCTPRHSNETIAIPVDDDVPPRHFVRIPAWVNGWCLMAWIVRGDAGFGCSPLADEVTPAEGRLLLPGNQRLVDRVAKDVRAANQVLASCDLAFRLCEVNVLDIRRIFIERTNGPMYPQELPVNGKWQFSDRPGARVDFPTLLSDILTDGGAWVEDHGGRRVDGEVAHRALREKLRKRCVHLFYVADVEDAAHPDDGGHATAGVGGGARFNATAPGGGEVLAPFVMIESGGEDTGQTIAHEIGHALGLPHTLDDEETDPAVRDDPQNLMRKVPGNGISLQPSQCRRMFETIRAYWVDPACP